VTLYVVRHGRTEANAGGLLLGRADPVLDDEGRRQAERIAAVMPSDALVVASPLLRAAQTAAAISDDVRLDERLIELDYGSFDLTPVADVPAEVWHSWRSDPHFRPPGGESHAELEARVSQALDELALLAVDGDVVVVSHVSPIKAAVAWTLGVSIEVSWRCYVAQASITRVGVARSPNPQDEGGVRTSLRTFNETHHLDG
jgi:broad specificity phosphatase PhoE